MEYLQNSQESALLLPFSISDEESVFLKFQEIEEETQAFADGKEPKSKSWFGKSSKSSTKSGATGNSKEVDISESSARKSSKSSTKSGAKSSRNSKEVDISESSARKSSKSSKKSGAKSSGNSKKMDISESSAGTSTDLTSATTEAKEENIPDLLDLLTIADHAKTLKTNQKKLLAEAKTLVASEDTVDQQRGFSKLASLNQQISKAYAATNKLYMPVDSQSFHSEKSDKKRWFLGSRSHTVEETKETVRKFVEPDVYEEIQKNIGSLLSTCTHAVVPKLDTVERDWWRIGLLLPEKEVCVLFVKNKIIKDAVFRSLELLSERRPESNDILLLSVDKVVSFQESHAGVTMQEMLHLSSKKRRANTKLNHTQIAALTTVDSLDIIDSLFGRGIVHNDLYFNNWTFDTRRWKTLIIDWDRAEKRDEFNVPTATDLAGINFSPFKMDLYDKLHVRSDIDKAESGNSTSYRKNFMESSGGDIGRMKNLWLKHFSRHESFFQKLMQVIGVSNLRFGIGGAAVTYFRMLENLPAVSEWNDPAQGQLWTDPDAVVKNFAHRMKDHISATQKMEVELEEHEKAGAFYGALENVILDCCDALLEADIDLAAERLANCETFRVLRRPSIRFEGSAKHQKLEEFLSEAVTENPWLVARWSVNECLYRKAPEDLDETEKVYFNALKEHIVAEEVKGGWTPKDIRSVISDAEALFRSKEAATLKTLMANFYQGILDDQTKAASQLLDQIVKSQSCKDLEAALKNVTHAPTRRMLMWQGLKVAFLRHGSNQLTSSYEPFELKAIFG